MSTPQPEATVRIEPLKPADAADFARVHRRAFPEYNSTKLGFRFCCGLYARYAAEQDCFGMGAWRGDSLLGIVIGGTPDKEKRIASALRIPAALAMLRRPHLWLNAGLLRKARSFLPWRKPSSKGSCSTGVKPPAEEVVQNASVPAAHILIIATAPEARGQGIGRKLLDETAALCQRRGFARIELSVNSDNYPARRLYESAGWCLQPHAADARCVIYARTLSAPAI